MQFSTKIPIQKFHNPINFESKIVSFGSCFAENMAEKFNYFQFFNFVNPFGIIFNPFSLEKIIARSVNLNYFTQEDIFFHHEAWHCFEVHSLLSNPDQQTFLEILNGLIDQTNSQLKTASHCFITLGTAWVYKHLESNLVVANCHKMPQKNFEKIVQTKDEIKDSLTSIIEMVNHINPSCQFVFTVSPVRHSKDGFVENNVSKAHLLSAVFEIVKQNNCVYFPSFEIVMDELRDYRFYEADLLHPNQLAIDYIWEKFKWAYIDETVYNDLDTIDIIHKSLNHRVFNPNSKSHEAFLVNLNQKIETIKLKLPHLKF